MEKQEMESLLIDYIDGKLNERERQKIEREITLNPDVARLHEELKAVMHLMSRSPRLEPSAELKSSFNAMLEQEIGHATRSKTIFFRPSVYRAAAAIALLALGVTMGFWISQYRRQQDELAEIKKEMQETKLALMAMLDNDQSASQRVLGATVALRMDKADTEIVNALVRAMNEDPSTNVRLAALDALKKFHQDPAVRKVLIASLATQKDPVVQINLIRLLVEMQEKAAVKELQRISTDE
ncbi:MAG TPA: HEAT repeat domain-containing protein, partial [Ohtaekwangia sp.]|nr:HEAT repeat domain-containing protein [Ohtaekwangia sp.]